MRLMTAMLFFTVELGGVFGQASAEAVTIDEQSMTVEISVEVEGEVDAVIAHLTLANEPDLALPLLDREDGTFGITTEVKPADYQVVFETLGGASSQSQPVALSDLGVDLSGAGGPPVTTEEGYSAATTGWGWLALAFGAASLAALAFWVLGGRDDDDDEGETVTGQGEDEAAVSDDAVVDAAQPTEGSTPGP